MAGGATSILADSALNAIHGHSHGTPRVIDNLMKEALRIGAQNDKQVIDSEVILAAVENRNLV
jgi:type II secretory pathway predicted ATPase ExeA